MERTLETENTDKIKQQESNPNDAKVFRHDTRFTFIVSPWRKRAYRGRSNHY